LSTPNATNLGIKGKATAFMITALNHGTNPSTAGNQASLLLALSRFGRQNQTPERPFALTMLADPQQQEAADSWVQMFRNAPDTGSTYRQHFTSTVKAFRAGHVQAGQMPNLNVLPIR
jgi:hypothetical protein